jgi:hypothetical protein
LFHLCLDFLNYHFLYLLNGIIIAKRVICHGHHAILSSHPSRIYLSTVSKLLQSVLYLNGYLPTRRTTWKLK